MRARCSFARVAARFLYAVNGAYFLRRKFPQYARAFIGNCVPKLRIGAEARECADCLSARLFVFKGGMRIETPAHWPGAMRACRRARQARFGRGEAKVPNSGGAIFLFRIFRLGRAALCLFFALDEHCGFHLPLCSRRTCHNIHPRKHQQRRAEFRPRKFVLPDRYRHCGRDYRLRVYVH